MRRAKREALALRLAAAGARPPGREATWHGPGASRLGAVMDRKGLATSHPAPAARP